MLFVVVLIGNIVLYHITQPSTDNDVQIVSLTATMLNLMCSLNISIPLGVVVTWLHNGSVILTKTITQDDPASHSAMLLRGKPQPSYAGVYQCVFNDTTTGYILRRNITVLSMYNISSS